ncbi:cytochrome c/c1 heme-lyase [Xylariaceae sp. FL0594]|nr:cytochrome c/c1 heme-lyase [Xylariaceae sp. FL0594]
MSTSSTNQPETCPVDHKSREAWLEKARAASASSGSSLPLPHPHADTRASPNANANAAETCPVDHGAREVWLRQARAASEATTTPAMTPNPTRPARTSPAASRSSWAAYLPRIPFLSPSPAPDTAVQQAQKGSPNAPHLGVDREVSSIPRTVLSSPTPGPAGDHGAPSSPANHEQETGADAATGNWIYPSERMFFEAMKRKGHDPRAADMRTVVPIHNAVNERAWTEIKAWERPWIEGTSCDGPRLHSFLGLSTHMSPKARFNTFLGYQAPFDRHDWVVDRCGKEIEYVIDFYAGRGGNTGPDGKLSFYLDVRPKLNSWEGIKMRAFRAAGLT